MAIPDSMEQALRSSCAVRLLLAASMLFAGSDLE